MGSKDNVDQTAMANAIQNIEDCVALFPKLEEGLDINVKFSDCLEFEFTSAIAMFDSYNIRMLHGWVSDPQDIELHTLLKDKSYNEIVDFLTSDIDSKESDETIAKIEQEKTTLRQFLSDHKQQLTAHGLFRMHEVMKENEVAIFFRNNHFSAVYKRNGQIWELVTDEGIVDADPRITWQSLSQLTGDEQFVNNKFMAIGQNINQQQQLESYKNNTNEQKDIGNVDMQRNDSAVAKRLALEDELGVSSNDFEKLQKEQQEAMQQLEQEKIQKRQQQNASAYQRPYPSEFGQNHQNYAFANEYQPPNNNNNNVDRYSNNTGNRTKKKKKRSRKNSDDCVVL